MHLAQIAALRLIAQIEIKNPNLFAKNLLLSVNTEVTSQLCGAFSRILAS
jgi:hypothetical protein